MAPIGTVIYFSHQTGFGVIQNNDGTGIYVRYDAIQDSGLTTLYEGQHLMFDIVKDSTCVKAVNPRLSKNKSM
ncbi:MAG TPA: cold-shock protein [Deltaproteobacteria bacterium]|nr:cold-shock protein [Deltaproteobacteria bacterium]